MLEKSSQQAVVCMTGVHDDLYNRSRTEDPGTRPLQVSRGQVELFWYRNSAVESHRTATRQRQRTVNLAIISTGQSVVCLATDVGRLRLCRSLSKLRLVYTTIITFLRCSARPDAAFRSVFIINVWYCDAARTELSLPYKCDSPMSQLVRWTIAFRHCCSIVIFTLSHAELFKK